MIRNIFIHFSLSITFAFISAELFIEYTICDAFCGLYYIYAAVWVFPMFFLLGLFVPIALSKYPKNKHENSQKNKRKKYLLLGSAGMLSVFLLVSITFYNTVRNENKSKYIRDKKAHSQYFDKTSSGENLLSFVKMHL